MTTEGRKACMTFDTREVEEMTADARVTCGMCGVKVHNAADVCEAGLHSDVT